MTNFNQIIGQRIREIRQQAGLSQESLGERIMQCQTVISFWELGKALPRLDALITICQACEVSLSDFFEAIENDVQ